ncbi:MAG TPA: PTS fructose transporter subunit IIB [Lachnoclostridium sp.]|jgi:fructose-specific phosphotransferase system IIB component|uniref:PTS fructose transporter subunit IIB n=1 Tax=Lacrimispora sp. TaxID=2719234 RepID=UPI000EC69C1F|nr:fructose PTS transporter subunit IIB [Lacrimispora sp.]HCD45082.1 PTS fructose transporter subunit IIB [Lachnoclostridium sp.]
MYIIGVTSCSTGIAHTYMAAEAIKKAAKRHGYKAKIETQGSIGIENKLNTKDIESADLILICADVSLREPERFDGRKVYESKTELFIKDAEKALKAAMDYMGVKE